MAIRLVREYTLSASKWRVLMHCDSDSTAPDGIPKAPPTKESNSRTEGGEILPTSRSRSSSAHNSHPSRTAKGSNHNADKAIFLILDESNGEPNGIQVYQRQRKERHFYPIYIDTS